MNKIKRIQQYICGVALLACLGGCTNEDYKLYDTTQKDSVFFEYVDENGTAATSVEYNFNYDIATVHTIELPVTLMGMPVDYEREIKIVPVAENTDMIEGTHYTIEGAVLPANAITTKVKINLKREDPELQERSFHMQLQLLENDDLRAVGQNLFDITYSDIRPETRPDWWVAYASWPTYSFEAAQVFFDYFYRLAPEANRTVFNQMIATYGDYFVNAVSMQGPWTNYDAFLRKYVLIPMYADHKDDFEWKYNPNF